MLNWITPTVASLFIKSQWKGKINFLSTVNVTVADPAGCSFRSPVQFFSRLNLILNAYLLLYIDLLINKNNCERFI